MADTGKRRFDNDEDDFSPEQLAILKCNQSKNQDVFKGVSRGVAQVQPSFGTTTSSVPLGKMQSSSKPLTTIRKAEQSLMNCALNSTNDIPPEQVWGFVEAVVKSMKNTDPEFNSDNKMALGNYYQHGNFCEFQMGMYKSQETSGNLLDFKRMSGDGFVMDNFYREVRKGIRDSHPDLLMDIDSNEDFEDDMDAVFDDFTDSEDDEDDDEDLPFLQIGGPLKLSSDSTVVKHWIDDIQNRHIEDKNHRMGLMAHNASHDDNRTIIINEGGEDLTTLVATLLSGKECQNAALVRNTAVLAHEMSKEVNFNDTMFDAIFEALAMWVPGNGRKDSLRLTESRETVLNLIFVLDYQVKRGAVTLQALQNKAQKRFTKDLPEAFQIYVEEAMQYDVTDEFAEQIQLLNDLVSDL